MTSADIQFSEVNPLSKDTSPGISGDNEGRPVELALRLPNSPGQCLNLRLTIRASVIQLFVTTGGESLATVPGQTSRGGSMSAMGSLVFAMPDARNPTSAISTPLYTQTSTLDFATRLARVLAVKTEKGVYVSSSASFQDCVGGGTVDEEMDGFRRIVAVVLARI